MHKIQFQDEFKKQLLKHLLEKYERSKSFQSGEPPSRRIQISFQIDNPFRPDYEDEMDYLKSEWMNEVLQQLEQQKIISLKWVKFSNNRVNIVYLQHEALERAYQILGRQSKLHKLQEVQASIKKLENHPWQWVSSWAKQTNEKLKRRESTGIQFNNLKFYSDLHDLLVFLVDNNQTYLKRTLSQLVFKDSKHFERNIEKGFIQWVKKVYSHGFDSDDELLGFFGIHNQPVYVKLKGDIIWGIAGETPTSTASYKGGLALSTETVQQMELLKINAEAIIFIENLTSYEQWIQQRTNQREIVLYTGGYPSKIVQFFLRKLEQLNGDDIPIYHWGDIDMGGIKIFEFIKGNFAACLQPLLMDIPTVKEYVTKGKAMEGKYKKTFQNLLENDMYNKWYSMIEYLISLQITIEQEAIINVADITLDRVKSN